MQANSEYLAAIAQFRSSAQSLKSVTDAVDQYDVLVNETESAFARCDDTLNDIYARNERSDKLHLVLGGMRQSVDQQAAEIEKITESVKVLETAEKSMRVLKEIESHFAEKDFFRLVVKVEQLRSEMSENPHKNAKVFSGVRKQISKWQKISSEWLGACLDQCVTITNGEGNVSCSVEQKSLKNLCKDASCDLLTSVFTLFSNQLLSNIVVPVLRRSVLSTNENTDVLVINLAKDDLTDIPDRFDSGTESAAMTVIPSIISVFKFVKEKIFIYLKSRKFYHDIVSRFGSLIVGDMSSLFCSIFLRPLLPNQPSKLGNFHKLVSQIGELQSYLEEAGFQQEPNKLLNEFVSSHMNIVLEKYETDLLVQVRDIMLLNWEEISSVKSDDPYSQPGIVDIKLPSRLSSHDSINESLFGSSQQALFNLPPCQVSTLLIKFVESVRQVFEEMRVLAERKTASVEDDAWLAGVLRFLAPCARHAADMFLAFLPLGAASMKCGSLMSAAIMLCDCAYFANSMLKLEVEFATIKRNLAATSPLSKNALPPFIFLDMVQPARSHGWTAFRKALEQTRSQLLEVDLDAWCQGAGGKLMASGFRARCEQSLSLAITKLSHVITSLRAVLPQTLASAALAMLLDAVLSMVVTQLASRVDISDAESRVHFEMLNRFSDDLISKVGALAAAEHPGQQASPIMGKVYLSKLCPESWPRYLDMISLLDSDLASIVNRWADGAGPLANSFAADELRTIIRALFQNSEVRQRALNAIK